jgi:hypothetical protein
MKGFVTDPKKATAFERMQLSWTGGLFYEAILLACAGGCDAPLVGHNVALRWSAMVKIAKRDGGSTPAQFGGLQFWSEAHVSAAARTRPHSIARPPLCSAPPPPRRRARTSS